MTAFFSARTRRKNPLALYSPSSSLRKAVWESEKQTGRKAIHTIPVLNSRKQNKLESTKIARRFMRLSTGRALDLMGLNDKKTRAIVQKGMQQSLNTKTAAEEVIVFSQMRKELKWLTKTEMSELIRLIKKVQQINFDRFEELL